MRVKLKWLKEDTHTVRVFAGLIHLIGLICLTENAPCIHTDSVGAMLDNIFDMFYCQNGENLYLCIKHWLWKKVIMELSYNVL